jgi:hypothetical protein
MFLINYIPFPAVLVLYAQIRLLTNHVQTLAKKNVLIFQSTITHVNNDAKFSLVATFQSDPSYEGRVRILATVVQEYDKFWTKIPSQEIEIR